MMMMMMVVVVFMCMIIDLWLSRERIVLGNSILTFTRNQLKCAELCVCPRTQPSLSRPLNAILYFTCNSRMAKTVFFLKSENHILKSKKIYRAIDCTIVRWYQGSVTEDRTLKGLARGSILVKIRAVFQWVSWSVKFWASCCFQKDWLLGGVSYPSSATRSRSIASSTTIYLSQNLLESCWSWTCAHNDVIIIHWLFNFL